MFYAIAYLFFSPWPVISSLWILYYAIDYYILLFGCDNLAILDQANLPYIYI